VGTVKSKVQNLPLKGTIESTFQFSKNARETQYIHHPLGKREFISCESIRPIRKRNQSDDALAAFENSNEIPKYFAYLA